MKDRKTVNADIIEQAVNLVASAFQVPVCVSIFVHGKREEDLDLVCLSSEHDPNEFLKIFVNLKDKMFIEVPGEVN